MKVAMHPGIPLHGIRVIDSDTVEAWAEVSWDLRQLWRIRLQGIEGGELGTEQGETGKLALKTLMDGSWGCDIRFLGNSKSLDLHGRRVGDIVIDGRLRVSTRLKEQGTHWHRTRSGKEKH